MTAMVRRLGVSTLGLVVVVAAVLACVRRGAETGSAALAATDLPDRDIAFWEAQVARDGGGTIGFARLSGAYLRRFRESEWAVDARRAEAAARCSLGLRTAGNAEAMDRLAESLLSQHRFAEALAAATGAVAEAPGHIPSLRLHAEVLLELGEYDAFERTLGSWANARGNPAVQATLGRYRLLRGEVDDGLALLAEAAETVDRGRDRPGAVAAWFHRKRGDALGAVGRTADAERAYLQALARFPRDAMSLYALGLIAAGRGDWQRSFAWADRAVAILPRPEVLGLLADGYAALGRRATAERLYEFLAAEAPRADQGIVFDRHVALFLADHDRHLDRAYALARAELAVRHDIYAHDTLAWVACKSGRLDEASEMMDQALRLGTRDVRLYYHAGMIAAARGETAAARRYLREALGLDPCFLGAESAAAALVALERG